MSDGKYKQAFSYFHTNKDEQERDLKSKQVLIADEFFYFGSGAIPVDRFKINIPRTQTAYGIATIDETEIARFWKYLEDNFEKNILLYSPHTWDEKEKFNNSKFACS